MVPEKSEVALVVKESSCGVEIDQADSKKRIETLSRLASHSAELERMGNNARAALPEKYSTRHVVRHFQDLIKSTARHSK